jgi:hypothetical protein
MGFSKKKPESLDSIIDKNVRGGAKRRGKADGENAEFSRDFVEGIPVKVKVTKSTNAVDRKKKS